MIYFSNGNVIISETHNYEDHREVFNMNLLFKFEFYVEIHLFFDISKVKIYFQ